MNYYTIENDDGDILADLVPAKVWLARAEKLADELDEKVFGRKFGSRIRIPVCPPAAKAEKYITIRARAFFGRLETLSCCVESNGTVTVFDSMAGQYTRSHSLSNRDLGRIRAAAKRQETKGVPQVKQPDEYHVFYI